MAWVPETELIFMFGKDMAANILHHFGGQRLYVPRQAEANHVIAQHIGLEAMAILCAVYPSQVLELPSPNDRITAKKMICALLDEGKSYSEIARRVRVGVRYVEVVASERRKKREGPKQGTLWE